MVLSSIYTSCFQEGGEINFGLKGNSGSLTQTYVPIDTNDWIDTWIHLVATFTFKLNDIINGILVRTSTSTSTGRFGM